MQAWKGHRIPRGERRVGMVPVHSKPAPHGLLTVSALAASHSFQLFADRREGIDSTTRSPRFAGATLLINRTVKAASLGKNVKSTFDFMFWLHVVDLVLYYPIALCNSQAVFGYPRMKLSLFESARRVDDCNDTGYKAK